MLNSFASWRRERSVIRELTRLSDRELDDVGIGRDQIGAVVRSGRRLEADTGLAGLAPSWAVQNRRVLSA